MAEAGLTGYESALWTAFVLPAGAPAPIVERLNREVVAVVNSPEAREALDKQGVVIDTGTPEALAKRIREDVVKWRDLIVSAGIGAQ
jgi:tripartite-type tricarboxylate transporter receptor subunit TctC